MICSKCGHEIEKDAKFCPYCGEAVLHFKTSGSEPETPKQKKEISFRQKMINILLAAAIVIVALGMIGLRAAKIMSDRKLFTEAAYVRDNVLYVDMNILDDEDMVYSLGTVDTALLEYGFDDIIASFAPDRKTLYYMDKDTGNGSGRLKKVSLKKLGDDEEISDRAVKVADFVTDYNVLGSGHIFYTTNDGEAFLYNGKKSTQLAEDVASAVVSPDGNYVFCQIGDEQASVHELVRIGLNSRGPAVSISESCDLFSFADNGSAILYTEAGETADGEALYLASAGKDPVKVADMVVRYSYSESSKGIFYTANLKDDVCSLYYYDIDGMKSELIGNGLTDIGLYGSISTYRMAGGDTWYYVVAGSTGKELADVTKVSEVCCSPDGRYVLVETENEEGTHQVCSYRAADGTLSSRKILADNGVLGGSFGADLYYLKNDTEEEATDLYTFHNERTSCIARDINTEGLVMNIYDADDLTVVEGFEGSSIRVYERSGEEAADMTARGLLYAGRNAVIYLDEAGDCKLLRLYRKEYEEILLAEKPAAVILPGESSPTGYFYGNE